MNKLLIAYGLASLSPVERGGNFSRARSDPRSLILELHAEQEDIRSQRRVVQERLSMRSRQMSETAQESHDNDMKSVYAWLVSAAVVLIFGLLFSPLTAGSCGAFGRISFSSLLLIVGIVLAVRSWSEYNHVQRDRKNHSGRIEQYTKECEQLNEQLYKLNLREAELEESIRSAQKYV